MGKVQLNVIVWEEDGLYVSKCPEIEVASCGESPQEALENIHEAINLSLDNARSLGMMDEKYIISEHAGGSRGYNVRIHALNYYQ